MFFISWGSRGGVADAGSAGCRHCNHCDQDSAFSRIVQYRVRHIYWIFRWVTDVTPFHLCGNCGGAHQADDADHGSKEVRKAIPAWDRLGWAVGAGGIAAIVATGSIAAASDNASNKMQVATPQVGDIYEVDIAQLMTRPEATHMYSTMRVTGVHGDKVEVELAKGYYDRWRGVDKDLSSGRAADADYYAPDKLEIPSAEIHNMYDAGTIHDVQR